MERSVPARLRLLLAAGLLAAAPGLPPAAAQDAPEEANPFSGEDEPLLPLTPEEEKAARALFAKAREYVDRGHGIAARKLFREFLEKYPGADPDLLDEADDRCGDNFLAGIELMHDAGPSTRRIDVELMGDGYTIEIFRKFKGHAASQMIEFWNEPLYREYENYINVWRFDLVSKENGVDDVPPDEKGVPPPEDPKKLKRYLKTLERLKKRAKQYSTALDCKALGPGGQVYANREQVYRWRKYLKESDGLTIAFANKGSLGMGGGGIATTGRKVAVVHEFGHAFVGLVDEYVNNPGVCDRRHPAANAAYTDDPEGKAAPPPEEIPWRHWLDRRYQDTGMKVLLGGATYALGAFRPSGSCAMNTGGGAYCWVCREEGVLRIYSYLSPIDESGPVADRVRLLAGESKEFSVLPMKPKTHDIDVTWHLQVIATSPPPAADPDPAPPTDGPSWVRDDSGPRDWQGPGDRASDRKANPLPEGVPAGSRLKATGKKTPSGAIRSTVKLEKLPPGAYLLTARVVDDAKLPRYNHPWVIRDPERLLEDRRSWTVEVVSPSAAAPVADPPAAPPGGPPR